MLIGTLQQRRRDRLDIPEFKVKYYREIREGTEKQAKKNHIVNCFAVWDVPSREWCVISDNGQRTQFDKNACLSIWIKFGLCGLIDIPKDHLPFNWVKGLSPLELSSLALKAAKRKGMNYAPVFSDSNENGKNFPASLFP